MKRLRMYNSQLSAGLLAIIAATAAIFVVYYAELALSTVRRAIPDDPHPLIVWNIVLLIITLLMIIGAVLLFCTIGIPVIPIVVALVTYSLLRQGHRKERGHEPFHT